MAPLRITTAQVIAFGTDVLLVRASIPRIRAMIAPMIVKLISISLITFGFGALPCRYVSSRIGVDAYEKQNCY